MDWWASPTDPPPILPPPVEPSSPEAVVDFVNFSRINQYLLILSSFLFWLHQSSKSRRRCWPLWFICKGCMISENKLLVSFGTPSFQYMADPKHLLYHGDKFNRTWCVGKCFQKLNVIWSNAVIYSDLLFPPPHLHPASPHVQGFLREVRTGSCLKFRFRIEFCIGIQLPSLTSSSIQNKWNTNVWKVPWVSHDHTWYLSILGHHRLYLVL